VTIGRIDSWTVFYSVYIICLGRAEGADPLTVFYIVHILYLSRDEGADSWTVFYIVYILCLSRDEGACTLDCVLYSIYSLSGPR
jgi:hypothetical protein